MSGKKIKDVSQKRSVLKIMFLFTSLTILVVLVSAGVYVNLLYNKANQLIDQVGTPELIPQTVSAKVKPITLLLMGVDYRKQTGSMNTDVIMAISLNPETKSATVVSLPRDIQLKPNGLPSRKANYYYPYFKIKNTDTAFGKTKQLFGDYLDTPLDYMVTIDFNGFKKAIDKLGGLTIDVDMDMRYVDREDGTNINLKKGIQKLNGQQTLDFVRYRKSNRNTAESSDYARNKRQQQVLDQMLKEIKSFGGITKLGKIMDAIGSEMDTDIPSTQIRHLMETYYTIDRQNIEYIPIRGEWVSPYIQVKEDDMEYARKALQSELSEEAPVLPRS